MSLSDKHCRPCEGGTEPYTGAEAREYLSQLSPEWKLNPGATELEREYRFKDFYRTMSFVNAIAHIANVEDHHPDLRIGYGYCCIRYTTHAIKGLSENDFICAARIDLLNT
jgi:4a-hydroxytetrahydrobiopterin dehydratase